MPDYDRYYASLAASATASTNGTPSGLGIPGGDDFGVSDDEEDRKPSIEYLNSLNEYRKRSRSREDIGTPKSKVAKLTDVSSFDSGKVNGHATAPILAQPPLPDDAHGGAPLDDPIVYGKFRLLYVLSVVNQIPLFSHQSMECPKHSPK